MINKSFYVIMFMYAVSGGLLASQFYLADTFGKELTNLEGRPIRSAILDTLGVDRINQVSTDIVNANFDGTVEGQPFNRVIDFNVGMAYVVWEIVLLLSGTYIFYILFLFGINIVVISIIVVLYLFLFFRTIAGMLRGF